jgi:hypothetical protein
MQLAAGIAAGVAVAAAIVAAILLRAANVRPEAGDEAASCDLSE